FFQAEDGIRDFHVTGVQTCALPICSFAGSRNFFGIELYIIANEKIQASIPVIVEPGATRAPADPLIVNAGFARNICKRAVAVVRSEERRVGKECGCWRCRWVVM